MLIIRLHESKFISYGQNHSMQNSYLSSIILGLSLMLLTSSCKTKYHYVDAYQVEPKIEQQDEHKQRSIEGLSIETKFAGDAYRYLVFELDIENTSSDSLFLDGDHIHLKLFDYQAARELSHMNKDRLIYDLENEQGQLKKEKKRRMIGNIVFAGLNIIGAAASGNAADVLLTGADGAIIAAEDNQYYKLVDGDIEQQIEYIEAWMFDDTWLQPGEKYSWDLLFERVLFDGDAELEIRCDEQSFTADYELYIREQ